MELSPKAITNVEFHLVRKGYDPDEVRAFLTQVARGVEALQTQLTNADARARAAVARMQELSAASPSSSVEVATPTPAPVVATPTPALLEHSMGDTDTIAKTLLLAQRTADATVAEAQSKAAAIVSGAEDRARTVVDQAESRATVLTRDAESEATSIIDKAKSDAVEASAAERARIQSELASMRAERDQLQANVTELGAQLIDQRGRLEQTVNALRAVLDDPRGLKPVTGSGLPAPSPGVGGGVVTEARRSSLVAEVDPEANAVFEVASTLGLSDEPRDESFDDLRWSGERD